MNKNKFGDYKFIFEDTKMSYKLIESYLEELNKAERQVAAGKISTN